MAVAPASGGPGEVDASALAWVRRRPSAYLPLVLSLAALLLVVGFVATVGVAPPTDPPADEGTAARLFQSMMLAQLPVIAFFGLRWVPQAPRRALPVLVVQFLAAAAPLALVLVLEW